LIFVDTSVRSDFFTGTETPQAQRLDNDGIIAATATATATATAHGVPLLHNDKDFEILSRHTHLEILRTPRSGSVASVDSAGCGRAL
jgi:predicted nucleic acid-binding protein